MLIGDGEAGEKIIKETILSDYAHNYICCVVDDDSTKLHSIIHSKEMICNRNDIRTLANKFRIEEILLLYLLLLQKKELKY